MGKINQRRRWTQEDDDYLIANYANTRNKTLSEKIGRSVGSIENRARQVLDIRKSKAHLTKVTRHRALTCEASKRTQFKKGEVAYAEKRKGKNGNHPNSRKHHFTSKEMSGKNHPLYLPIGSVSENSHGTPMIKVSDDGGYNERWRPLPRVIWEKHKGPIPKGFNVWFKDGDKTNVDINNLELVYFRETWIRNAPWAQELPHELVSAIGALATLKKELKHE